MKRVDDCARRLTITSFGIAALATLLVSGCATSPQNDKAAIQAADEAVQFSASKPPELRLFYMNLYREGEWNAVLNFNQLGLAALSIGEFDVARKAFDQAIARIDAIYADEPNAKRALSAFNEEKVKDFKGEPYERAMTYFYRGVLYLQQGDYQNARASFLAADLQGTLAEREKYDSDFGLMKYVAGWASVCDGDVARGKALIQDAKKADSKIAGLPDEPGRALLLIDTGVGPRKVGVGQYKEAIGFVADSGSDKELVVRGANGALEIKEWGLGGDVFVQATTRGGRPIDAVLNGKAQFKGATNTVGNVAVVAGAAMMASNDRNLGAAGAVIALAGLIAKGVAYATTPAADLRQWSSLPAAVMLFTGDVQPEPGVTLESSASPKATLLPVQGRTGNCWIGWGRTRPALTVDYGGPVVFASGKVETANRDSKNKAFRDGLLAEFPNSAPAPADAERRIAKK